MKETFSQRHQTKSNYFPITCTDISFISLAHTLGNVNNLNAFYQRRRGSKWEVGRQHLNVWVSGGGGSDKSPKMFAAE